MPTLLPHLGKAQQRELFENLNYLNLQEYQSFCKQHSIPYKILVETSDGRTRSTKDTDRKPIVLHRIRQYVRTGRVLRATRLAADIVRSDHPPRVLKPTHRLYYGWYDKKNTSMTGLLENLTQGRFKNGAVARVLMMKFWTQGEAPTFAAFAKAWVKAKKEEHKLLTPEYAFLTDLQRNEVGKHWKDVRKKRAVKALKTLAKISKRRMN